MSDYQLVHGDCREVFARLKANSVNAVITDIPYANVSRASSGLRVLDKGDADVATFGLRWFIRECARVAGEWVYVWCDWRQLSTALRLMEHHGLMVRPGDWVKTDGPVLNGDKGWTSGIELCAIGRKPRAYFARNCVPAHWTGPVERNIKWHPTPKPVWLMRDQVTASVPLGGLVFDPCGGSGATGVACLEEGRSVIVSELSAEYFPKMSKRIAGAQYGLFAQDVVAEAAPKLRQEELL